MTGSKSKTLIASLGFVIRSCSEGGAQTRGSWGVSGAADVPSAASAARPGNASSGLADNHLRSCRRLSSLSLGFMTELSPRALSGFDVPASTWYRSRTRNSGSILLNGSVLVTTGGWITL